MSKKKKILVYHNTLFLISETFAYHQVEALSKKFDIELMAENFVNPHNYDVEKFTSYKLNRPDGIKDKVFSKLIRNYFNTKLDLNVRSYLQLLKLFRNKSIDCIHAHFAPNALKLLNIAKHYKIPLVVSFHGYDASQLLNDDEYRKSLPDLFNYASAIVISGRHMHDNLGLDEWDHKVHFVPYGVNPDELKVMPKEENDKVVILHSGRIVNKKGVPDLIKVFNELKSDHEQIELRIVGDGKELEECRELVDTFNLNESVNFYGAIPHQKVAEMLNQADIFVLNSRTGSNGDMEGTPVTILEAMCMEKAIVSTRHAGIPYVIEHGKNGLLADEKDNRALKANLKQFINNHKLRKELGEEARNTLLESYSSEVMEQNLTKVFESI